MEKSKMNIQAQQGATLVVALIILIVLMLLGIAAVVTSNTQFKLAGNLQFQNAAKNSAEGALAEQEDWIALPANALNSCFTIHGLTCGNRYPRGYFTGVPDPRTVLSGNRDSMIELLAAKVAPPGAGLGDVCGAPGVAFELNLYRITTMGEDARGATRYIQSVFQTRIPC